MSPNQASSYRSRDHYGMGSPCTPCSQLHGTVHVVWTPYGGGGHERGSYWATRQRSPRSSRLHSDVLSASCKYPERCYRPVEPSHCAYNTSRSKTSAPRPHPRPAPPSPVSVDASESGPSQLKLATVLRAPADGTGPNTIANYC